MIRDKHRDKEHFRILVDSLNNSHVRRIKKFEKGKIKSDRIIPIKQAMAANLIKKMVAMYSMGESVEKLLLDIHEILDLIEASWMEGNRKLVGNRSEVLNQYTIDAYTQLLRLMSVGFLLGLEEDFFQRLVQLVRKDDVIDLVFEFILSSRLPELQIKQEKESYKFGLYRNLKKAISQSNNKKAEEFVKVFLEEDWLEEQKRAQILSDPKKDTYYGRWSFEAAAVVAIKDLDDISFRYNEYYPKDLVDYYREHHSDGRSL